MLALRNQLKMYLLSVLFLCSLVSCLSHGQVIEEHPMSLLIPVNATAVFTCKADCAEKCHMYWVINGNNLDTQQERSQTGFIFSVDREGENKYITMLSVNATEAINNTEVYCVFEKIGDIDDSNHSLTATLLVVAESPMISNPSIEKNSTQVSLLWSPQFLWPGQRIDYYNISFMNKSNGNITTSYYRVNSTFSDQVVKLTKIHPNDIDLCTTAEIEFKISAVSVSGHLLPIINVTDWITPSSVASCATTAISTIYVTTATDPVTKISYKTAFGILLSVITVLLLAVMILTVCATHLCSRRFKRRTYRADMRSKDTKARSYDNMVHNPIYTGLSSPVYDSIWPLAETLGEHQIPSSADHCFRATSNTDTEALQGMSAECAPNRVQHNESLRW